MARNLTKTILNRAEKVHDAVDKYSLAAGLDPNLVRALITQESRFIADAVSPTGAYGYGQFTTTGVRQVQEIATMHNKKLFGDLAGFKKSQASDPDIGIKAVCAFLWWLFEVKYGRVLDEQVKLEASLTFYNAGGKAGNLVVKHGGFLAAKPYIAALPSPSQGATYAEEVLEWYAAWNEVRKPPVRQDEAVPSEVVIPEQHYWELTKTLKLLAATDPEVTISIKRSGPRTEITLSFPGDYSGSN